MSASIFNVNQPVDLDESIKSYSFRSVYPFNNNQYNNNDEIVFTINQKEVFTLPHESQLRIEMTITRPAAEKTLAIKLSVGGVLHLFSKLTYLLNGQKIDEVNNVGVTAAMKFIPSMSLSESELYRKLLYFLEKDTFTEETIAICVPLKLFSGFFEDYQRVIFNTKQELVLLRSQINTNCLLVNPTKTVDVKITNMIWQMPFIEPNEVIKLQMMKMISNNTSIPIPFRNWGLYSYQSIPSVKNLTWPIRTVTSVERPRFLIVGFQTARENKIEKDNGAFDHCKVKNVTVYLGSDRYPYMNNNCDFTKSDVAGLFLEFAKFRQKYYGSSLADTQCDMNEFISNFPLWIIDTQHQPAIASSSNIDIKLEIESDENFPTDTTCHCLIISDRVIEFSLFSGVVKQLI